MIINEEKRMNIQSTMITGGDMREMNNGMIESLMNANHTLEMKDIIRQVVIEIPLNTIVTENEVVTENEAATENVKHATEEKIHEILNAIDMIISVTTIH